MPPLYDHRCPDCCLVHEAMMPVDEPTRDCPHCGGVAKRCFSSSYYINPDIDFVTDNIDGNPKRYTSKRELQKDMDKAGVHQKIGKGWW